MKLPKKVYLAAATLLFVGGAATAVILTQNNPKDVTVKQTATVNHPKVDTEATDTPESAPAKQVATTPAQNTETTPTTPISTADENKTKLKDLVYAQSAQINVDPDVQWSCIDRFISQGKDGMTYDNWDSIYTSHTSIGYVFLNTLTNDSGQSSNTYFGDAGTCRIYTKPA